MYTAGPKRQACTLAAPLRHYEAEIRPPDHEAEAVDYTATTSWRIFIKRWPEDNSHPTRVDAAANERRRGYYCLSRRQQEGSETNTRYLRTLVFRTWRVDE